MSLDFFHRTGAAVYATIATISALLVGLFFLLLGNGLLGTLVAVRLSAAEITTGTTGLVLAAYFAGQGLGAFRGQKIIASVGHIRAFAAFASILSAASLVHAFRVDPALWGALRFITGFCMVGLFMCAESWLNEKAPSAMRGRVLAFYMVTLYLAQGLGQFLLTLPDASGFGLFVVASILVSLALVPVALTRMPGPTLPKPDRMPLRDLLKLSPLGMVGGFAAGLVTGVIYSLGPVYAQQIGFGAGETARFMAAAIIGGLVLQWPLGHVSDRVERRLVIAGLCFALVGISILLAVTESAAMVWGLVLVGLFGGVGFALYPLSISVINDRADSESFVAVSGGLLLAYAAGATLGPVGAAPLMDWFGHNAFYITPAAVGVVVGGFALWRRQAGPTVAVEDQAPFQLVPRTTLVAAELDPRHEEDQYAFDFNAVPEPPPEEPPTETEHAA